MLVLPTFFCKIGLPKQYIGSNLIYKFFQILQEVQGSREEELQSIQLLVLTSPQLPLTPIFSACEGHFARIHWVAKT